MATFKAEFVESGSGFGASFGEDQSMKSKFGEVQRVSTDDYEKLYNKPQIEGNTLIGDKSFVDLGLGEITPQDIDDLFDEMIYGGK